MSLDYPDDHVPIREWLRVQRRDDWPKGHLVRIANIIEHESDLHTVGDVRDRTDAEFLRLPNVGKESLRSLRERLGPRTAPTRASVEDTVVPIRKHAIADLNGKLIERMQGCPAWTATPALRWNNGVLEQMYRASDGSTAWEPVPQAETMPQSGSK